MANSSKTLDRRVWKKRGEEREEMLRMKGAIFIPPNCERRPARNRSFGCYIWRFEFMRAYGEALCPADRT
jgi:hypothetical protein